MPLVTIIIGVITNLIFEINGAEQYGRLSLLPAVLDAGNWNLLLGTAYVIGRKVKGICQREADT